jgi:hypothetical protein
MKQLDEQGSTGLLIALIVTVVLLLGSLIFGFWAYGSQQDYKNNTDKKITAAVQIAEQQLSTKKDNEFAEAEKSPVKSFNGPSAYGSISLSYPKTWSAYADITGQNGQPVDSYFNPNFVPGISTSSSYALRLQVTQDSYDQQLQQFDSLVQSGKVTIKPYSFPNVKGVVGVRIDGSITSTASGTMILVPLRDKAIKLWTETDQFKNDFATYVLPNFKFSP